MVGGWANAWGNEHQPYKLQAISFGGNRGIGVVEGHDVRWLFSTNVWVPELEDKILRSTNIKHQQIDVLEKGIWFMKG